MSYIFPLSLKDPFGFGFKAGQTKPNIFFDTSFEEKVVLK